MSRDISAVMRSKRNIRLSDKLRMVWLLSIPTILAQISSIAMQYIDAAMVGSLGASASASIGLVSSTTWLFGGVCMAVSYGYSVQIAHAVGAGDRNGSRRLFRQGLFVVIAFSMLLMLIGLLISPHLPGWLGAGEEIRQTASSYFRVYALFVPIRQMVWYGGASLQASGNTRIPGFLNIIMCILDVVFNCLFIFGSGSLEVGFIRFPGLGLGVAGAALGTGVAELVTAAFMMYFACVRSEHIRIQRDGVFHFSLDTQVKAFRISLPIALEQIALCGAQVMSARIVAPLGTIAVAANSLGVTAESLCYMPGYGLEAAATTLVGQAVGAGRRDLARSFAWITTGFGILIMSITGFLMYWACPFVFGFLTPVLDVQELGVSVLRIELLAEPLFAASIVATGALRGAEDTLVPSIMNLVSIWGVRLVIAFLLAPVLGLAGVWIAMCVELCFRGIIFLLRLYFGNWLKNI